MLNDWIDFQSVVAVCGAVDRHQIWCSSAVYRAHNDECAPCCLATSDDRGIYARLALAAGEKDEG